MTENTDTDRLRALRRLMGYTQNASEVNVLLFEDDATRTIHIQVGSARNAADDFWGDSLNDVLDKVIAYQKEHPDD